MNKRPTLAITMHDGFYGVGTGAGYANHAFLRTVLTNLGTDVRLVVMPVRLEPTSDEYDPRWHRRTETLLADRDTTVLPLDNGTGGSRRFGGLIQFRHLVSDTAEVLERLVQPDADPIAIIALDAPFHGLAPVLPNDLRQHLTVIPRSTGALHDPDGDQAAWERDGLRCLAAYGGKVGCISGFMREHLHKDYGLPSAALIDVLDGLTQEEMTFDAADVPALPERATRDGFLFAMGRAEPYKGWDDLIDALAIACQRGTTLPHAVLAAVSDTSTPTEYQQHLAWRLQQERNDATLLTRFAPSVRNLLAHAALACVVVPSRIEPFGRIPLEAHAAGAYPVVTTTAGGLAEQVSNGETGFTAEPGNPDSLAAAIGRALALAQIPRHQMLREARRRLANLDPRAGIRELLQARAAWARNWR